jgi:hypothetical protein
MVTVTLAGRTNHEYSFAEFEASKTSPLERIKPKVLVVANALQIFIEGHNIGLVAF